MERKIRVGLALGAGSAKGIAHIGVIRVLEENGIPIDMIAGSSMGSVIAAMYASGRTTDDMERMIADFDRDGGRFLIDLSTSGSGVLRGKKVEKYLTDKIGNIDFSQTKIPLAAAACCLEDGSMRYFREGSVIRAVRASLSIPGVFDPVEIDGKTYVDGGVLDRVPCEILREMGADLIIAVDVGFRGGTGVAPRNVLDIVGRYLSLVQWQAMEHTMVQADCLLTPSCLDFNSSDFAKGREIVRRGRVEAMARLDEIRSTLMMAGVKLIPEHGGITE